MKNFCQGRGWEELRSGAPQAGIVALGLCTLLLTEWMLETHLSTTANGTYFATADGKVAEAIVRTGYRFAAWFNVTNLNPLQGVESQMLPLNVWANPVHWPLAFLHGKLATDIAGLVVLTCVAASCYVMARCFDLPRLPSAIAAQLCLVWVGPIGPLLSFTAVFVLVPGVAAVYSPYMLALGLLARLEPSGLMNFLFVTALIAALVFYSLSCDPPWSVVAAISWTVPFAVVALAPLRTRAVGLRCGALAGALALLTLGGPLLYAYTLTRSTARVFFSEESERAFSIGYSSTLFTSPYAKYYYVPCILGWTFGLFYARGRVRSLVVAGTAGFGFYLLYALAFLFLDVTWWLPLPIYIEDCLPFLFMASAVAGYWSAAPAIAGFARRFAGPEQLMANIKPGVWALIAIALVPACATAFALKRSKSIPASAYTLPWPDESEFVAFLSDRIGLDVGKPYRGSALILPGNHLNFYSLANLWQHSIPTVNEYGHLVTPQAVYLEVELLKQPNPGVNGFLPVLGSGGSYDVLFKTIQALGVRYVIGFAPFGEADRRNFAAASLPRRQPSIPPGQWQIYELPEPNLGHYSPTEIVVASSAAEIIAALADDGFDFRRQAVLSAPEGSLLPARNMRLTMSRGGGFHITGHSDGTSLVILPQQFTHCLRATDSRMRIVRANLMWTGVIFSGDINTDIRFDYGMFSPRCRLGDLADYRRLGLSLPASSKPADENRGTTLRAVMSALQ